MLNGATEWADGPLQTNDELLDFLKANKHIKEALIQSAKPPVKEGGRPRDPGCWPIAYLLFVISREPTIKRWCQKTDTRIWKRCRFKKRPKYDTVHHHFALLESFGDAYQNEAVRLMLHAVKESKGQVGSPASGDERGFPSRKAPRLPRGQ
jgi:hypothetical protein